jgi:ATP-dependent RNA helicase DeaD
VADRALDRAEALQAAVARTLESRSVDGELAMLAPLFERYDPAEVAAALLALAPAPPQAAAAPEGVAASQGWERLFINVGKRDRASAKDLVGALIREAGLAKEDIGKIDVRDTFTLCDLAPAAIERAAARLTGATIRGRRLAPRRDRG